MGLIHIQCSLEWFERRGGLRRRGSQWPRTRLLRDSPVRGKREVSWLSHIPFPCECGSGTVSQARHRGAERRTAPRRPPSALAPTTAPRPQPGPPPLQASRRGHRYANRRGGCAHISTWSPGDCGRPTGRQFPVPRLGCGDSLGDSLASSLSGRRCISPISLLEFLVRRFCVLRRP